MLIAPRRAALRPFLRTETPSFDLPWSKGNRAASGVGKQRNQDDALEVPRNPPKFWKSMASDMPQKRSGAATALHFVGNSPASAHHKDKRLDPACSEGSLRPLKSWFCDQLLKERPVVNHGLAQLFRSGHALQLPKRNAVG